jgi:hypothetical protein
VRSNGGSRVFILLFNKDVAPRPLTLSLAGGVAIPGNATLFRFDTKNHLAAAGTVAPSGGTLALTLPARSATLAVVDGISASGGARFFPLTPCRVVDTRSSIDPAAVKRGTFTDGETRAYTFSTSTECPGLSSTAKAWVIHVSFLPVSRASFLTVYPDGATRPLASTILGYPTKFIGDNAVISAGSGGTVDLYSQYAGNVVIDVNGYFK